jgi:hypothetical protein
MPSQHPTAADKAARHEVQLGSRGFKLFLRPDPPNGITDKESRFIPFASSGDLGVTDYIEMFNTISAQAENAQNFIPKLEGSLPVLNTPIRVGVEVPPSKASKKKHAKRKVAPHLHHPH